MVVQTFDQLIQKLNKLGKSKKILVTGVFDLIHQEHIHFLKKAREEEGVLIVGIESDVRVKKIKGDNRPVHQQKKRTENLEALGIADFVFVLPEQFSTPKDHKKLIARIKPELLAVSSHTKHLEKKREILQAFGGDVKIVHTHNPAISTTKLLEGILQNEK